MSEAKRKPPAFQLYAGDVLADTLVAQMTLEEFGAHMKLLCHAWIDEGVPNDPARLSRLLGVDRDTFDRIWSIVGDAWTSANGVVDGKLVNARMERERAKQAAYREERAEAGRRGAQARWGPSA